MKIETQTPGRNIQDEPELPGELPEELPQILRDTLLKQDSDLFQIYCKVYKRGNSNPNKTKDLK